MFAFKNKYFFIIESIRDIDLKNIKNSNKFSIIYRSKNIAENIEKLIQFRKNCKVKNIDFYVSNNIKLTNILKADGIYISAYNKNLKIVKAVNKNIRSSTRKLSPILRAIVGKKADEAIRDLSFSEKRISKDIKKTISSAVANAENNYQYDIDKLIIKEAYCGKQIVMKRFRARAKGRAASILKPYSNVTIILSEVKKMESHGSKS